MVFLRLLLIALRSSCSYHTCGGRQEGSSSVYLHVECHVANTAGICFESKIKFVPETSLVPRVNPPVHEKGNL